MVNYHDVGTVIMRECVLDQELANFCHHIDILHRVTAEHFKQKCYTFCGGIKPRHEFQTRNPITLRNHTKLVIRDLTCTIMKKLCKHETIKPL